MSLRIAELERTEFHLKQTVVTGPSPTLGISALCSQFISAALTSPLLIQVIEPVSLSALS